MRELQRRAMTWFVGTAVTIAAGCGSVDASDPTLQPHVLADGRWHADGSTLVDSAGREVILRGVNVGDRSTYAISSSWALTSARTTPSSSTPDDPAMPVPVLRVHLGHVDACGAVAPHPVVVRG